MEQELAILKDKSLEERLNHLEGYVSYIFRGDDPEDYLRSVFPITWDIYLLSYMHRQVENGGFRQFLWNTQEAYNQDIIKSLAKIKAPEYIEAFESILKRFHENIEEKNTFLSNDFADERSSKLRNDLREITWDFRDSIDANPDKNITVKLQAYIDENIAVLCKELAEIRVQVVEYFKKKGK